MSEWYWLKNSVRQGPCTEEEIIELFHKGTLNDKSPLWKRGFDDWVELGKVQEFADEVEGMPPVPVDDSPKEGIGKKVFQDLSDIDFKEEVIPLNSTNIRQMSKDFIFWSVSVLAVLPLFIVTLENIDYQLVGFALFFAFLWGVVFRQFVVKSNAPWHYLILSLFTTGIVSIQLLLLVYGFLPDFYNGLTGHDHIMVRLLGSILHTGVTEELCKILPVLFYFYKFKQNANPKHAILIGIFSGLGFAAFENLDYTERVAQNSVAMGYRAGESGVMIGALAAQVNVMLRALSLVFLHAVWTGIFSYFITVGVTFKSRLIALFVVGLTVSSVMHGFYNWFHSVQGTLSALVCAFAFMLLYSYLTKLDQMLLSKKEISE